MNSLQIGRQRFSELFWNIVDEKVGDYPYKIIEKIVEDQQTLREKADYNTGSLTFNDAVELYKLVKFFQPRVIAEVGTFIGVSTLIMSNVTHHIYTCDFSNDINLNTPNISQYPKKLSTEVFRDLAEKNIKVDLVYLDGRLKQDDIYLLDNIICNHTVFIMDDFEGIEKGVANAMMLERPERILIYPRLNTKTALLIPISSINLVSQEDN